MKGKYLHYHQTGQFGSIISKKFMGILFITCHEAAQTGIDFQQSGLINEYIERSNYWVQTGQVGPQDPKMGLIWVWLPSRRDFRFEFFPIHLPLSYQSKLLCFSFCVSLDLILKSFQKVV